MAEISPSKQPLHRGNMLTGNTAISIALFAFPVMLGNLAQQLYNTADAIVVGRVLGKKALAAISVASPIAFLAIFFLFGITVGLSVLLAQTYGAGNKELLRRQEATSLVAGLAFTLGLSLACIAAAEPILHMIRTPPELMEDAARYLRVVSLGLIFFFLNQYCAAVLRAVGNSRIPFFFLLLTSALHIGFDTLLVGVLRFGIAGTAMASLLAQGLSALGCLIYIYRHVPLLALKRSELRCHWPLLRQAVDFSWAAAVQQIVVYLGRFLVQGMVNPFGADMIAGYNAATRVEGFVISPFSGVSAATATYSAQNLGARQYQRIHRGLSVSLIMNLCYALLASIALFFEAPAIMGLFLSSDGAETVTAAGVTYLKHMAFFYILCGIGETIQGFFRGMGHLRASMVGSAGQILARVVVSWFLVPSMGIPGICWGTLVGWVLIVSGGGMFARHVLNKVERLADKAASSA